MKHKCFYKNEQVILSIVLFIFSIIICTSCSKKNDFSKTDISNETTTPLQPIVSLLGILLPFPLLRKAAKIAPTMPMI